MSINVRGIAQVLLEQGHLMVVQDSEPRVISKLFLSQQFRQLIKTVVRTFSVCVAGLLIMFSALPAWASDHQDTTFLATKLTAADLTDLYVFESPDPKNVVLALDFDPLITPGENRAFDPTVLYQFKIDNTGDFVEDLVLQFQVNGRGANQTVSVYGPSKPVNVVSRPATGVFGLRGSNLAAARSGTQSRLVKATGKGPLNQVFTIGNLRLFVGLRKDPFFFDLEQFFKVIPDRDYLQQPNPNPPFQVLTFRPPGQAVDFIDRFNVHSIVVELPRASLGTGKINAWITSSVQGPRSRGGANYVQIERLAVPALNELFMDFKDHNASNLQTPTADATNQSNFIRSFVNAIGRPQGIALAIP
jgi:hypothetical protein